MLLNSNANQDLLHSNCGPDDRKVSGNIIITFFNCTIYCQNQSFSSNVRKMETTMIQGAMCNLILNQHPEEDALQMINNKTISNREKIVHVYLMQCDTNCRIGIFSEESPSQCCLPLQYQFLLFLTTGNHSSKFYPQY